MRDSRMKQPLRRSVGRGSNAVFFPNMESFANLSHRMLVRFRTAWLSREPIHGCAGSGHGSLCALSPCDPEQATLALSETALCASAFLLDSAACLFIVYSGRIG